MKIEKTNEEITNIRKTTVYDFILTNDKGEEKEIRISTYYCDDEMTGYDNDETFYEVNDKRETEIDSWEDFVEKFFGEDADADEILDEIHDKMKED